MSPPERSCPVCDAGQLVVRTNHRTGAPFMACDRWPDCDYTEPMREFYRMQSMGHPELPLFEEPSKESHP